MDKKEFIEIVNWRKYQERMPDKGASWFKVHCSLANCEAFQALSYKDQMALIAIWTFAAESGRTVIKADRRYLFRNCRLLKEEPDLEPLLNAVDDYGRPNPFIRYVDSPVISDPDMPGDERLDLARNNYKKRDVSQSKSADKKARSQAAGNSADPLYVTAIKTASYDGYISVRKLQSKLRIGVSRAKLIIETMKDNGLLGGYFSGKGYAYKPAIEKCNTEKRREEETREEIPYRVSEEKKERKEEIRNKEAAQIEQHRRQNPTAEAQRQIELLMQAQAQDSDRIAENPIAPDRSDESPVSTPIGGKRATSSFRGGEGQSIGNIIKGDFKPHNLDGECIEFGREVLQELGYDCSADTLWLRSEIGAFSNWLFKLKNACGSSVIIDELKDKMRHKARKISKRARNKRAVLMHIMEKELNSRGIRLPDVRASPAS